VESWVPDASLQCAICGQTPCLIGMKDGKVVYEGSICGPCMWDGSAPDHCRSCGQCFSDENVLTEAGWIETRVSGLCEVCFDTLADLNALRDGAWDDQAAGEGKRRRNEGER
jgi:hypothetical protein